jgi:hypothetical protein
LGPSPLAVDAFQLPLDVRPVQRCLLDGDSFLLRVGEDDERHRPHRYVAPELGDEPRQLLVEERRHMQQRVLMVQRRVERVVREDPDEGEAGHDQSGGEDVARAAHRGEPLGTGQERQPGDPQDEADRQDTQEQAVTVEFPVRRPVDYRRREGEGAQDRHDGQRHPRVRHPPHHDVDHGGTSESRENRGRGAQQQQRRDEKHDDEPLNHRHRQRHRRREVADGPHRHRRQREQRVQR